MLNRSLQVSMVKKGQGQESEDGTPELTFEQKTIVVSDSIERAIRKIGFAVCAYVVLDTIRQVVVKTATD